ncbi:MAG: hypothetical protein J3K34DRAFT_166902 [Monoraphidium minutum]|nr:MAG: hypothetical protein J3K34DRAFT_166902 [Monoraphidium minutum]
MRSAEAWPEFLAAAVSDGGNAGFSIGSDGVGRLQSSDGGTKVIGRAAEGLRLAMLLGCGRHTRCCTPHSVKCVDDLICRFCTPDENLISMRRETPSSYERVFFEYMEAGGLAGRLWPQMRLDWWHGCIDFVDRSTGICFQVDGEQHFLGKMYNTPRDQHVARDAASCLAALSNGSVLVRLHYKDVTSGTGLAAAAHLMRSATARPSGPCVLLSPAFDLVGPNFSRIG